MNTKNIKLSLSTEEANIVLDALGQQPFIKVYALINEIQRQASEQLDETKASPQALSNGIETNTQEAKMTMNQ